MFISNFCHLIDKISHLYFINSLRSEFSNLKLLKILVKFDIFILHKELIPNLKNNEFTFFVIKVKKGIEPFFLNLQFKALTNMLHNHFLFSKIRFSTAVM